VILRLSEIGLGGIFIYAGALKAWNPALFASEIFNYQLLSWRISAVAALYLPWLEIICGLVIVIRRNCTGGLIIVSSLLLVFVGALTSAWGRGLDISCGCFGNSNHQPNFNLWIGRDFLLLIMSISLLCITLKKSESIQMGDECNDADSNENQI